MTSVGSEDGGCPNISAIQLLWMKSIGIHALLLGVERHMLGAWVTPATSPTYAEFPVETTCRSAILGMQRRWRRPLH